MPDYLVYGKIIIDDIRLADGAIARNILGGGGPQAVFGARLWSDSIGFLTRSGADIEDKHVQSLRKLDIDLDGWHKYPDIPTLRNFLLDYDQDEQMTRGGEPIEIIIKQKDWLRLSSQVLTLPDAYQNPQVIHLVSEYHNEAMVETALALREQGVIFSLEPIIDYNRWSNREDIVALLQQVDIVTPDWLSASGVAGSNDPKEVVKYWAKLGPSLIAIRRGHYGSYVWERNADHIWHIPPVSANVVDPTGAGNSYGGGLMVGWAETGDAQMAGCYGAVSARFLIERVGVPEMSATLQKEAKALLEQALASVRQL